MNKNQLCEDWGWYVDLENTRQVSFQQYPTNNSVKMLDTLQDFDEEYQFHIENMKKNDDYEENTGCPKKPCYRSLIGIGHTIIATVLIYTIFIFC
jgi:hypothetical protein